MKNATILVSEDLTPENYNWDYTSKTGTVYSQEELEAMPSYKSCTNPLSNIAYKVRTWKPTTNLEDEVPK